MRVGGSFTSALTSFAGLGMALMLEEAGITRVRLGWTDTAEPRLMISGEGVDDLGIARIVHAHATRSATDDSWLEMSLEEKPWSSGTAVFSPRIKEAQSDEEWHYLQIRRSQGIDQVIEESRRWLDLDLLGALGEPAYWRFRRNHPDPDQGASRWEMKTRNHGGGSSSGIACALWPVLSPVEPSREFLRESTGAALSMRRTGASDPMSPELRRDSQDHDSPTRLWPGAVCGDSPLSRSFTGCDSRPRPQATSGRAAGQRSLSYRCLSGATPWSAGALLSSRPRCWPPWATI